jgi:hypothetical protein
MIYTLTHRGKTLSIDIEDREDSHTITFTDGNKTKVIIVQHLSARLRSREFRVEYLVQTFVDGELMKSEPGFYDSDPSKNEYSLFYLMQEHNGVKVIRNMMNAVAYAIFGINCFDRTTGEFYQPVTFDVFTGYKYDANGEIISRDLSIMTVDGIGPFLFSIDGGTTFQETSLYEALPAGEYTIVVKDSLGITEKLIYNHG